MRVLRSGAGLWLLAFAGFFLLHAAWAFAAPYDGPPDEQAHAMRAAAVAHGELLPASGHIQMTPSSIVRAQCFPMFVETPANCASEPGGDEAMAPTWGAAAYYNPVYYWATAWPVAVWPNWTGIMLARLLNGAAMAALLASAVVAACRWTRHRAVVAGLVVASTPMIAHLGGAINPNGVEIAAGVALFAALIPLLLEREHGVDRRAVVLAGISACVLVTPRSLGVMWLGVILVTMLIGTSRARLRTLLHERVVRSWLAAIAVCVVASGAWTIIARPQRLPSGTRGMTFVEIVRGAFLDVWPNLANQMVGVTGWSEVLQPRLIYVAWFMAVGLLVLGGFLLGSRADRWRMLALTVGTFVPLLGAELLLVNQQGWFNQGRYFLPGAVGLPMLGAHVLARQGVTAINLRAITRMLAVVLVPIQFICLAYTMCRWQSGLRILNPLKGSWLPRLGPVLPLATAALAVLVLLVLYWRASSLRDGPPATTRREPEKAPEDQRTEALVAIS